MDAETPGVANDFGISLVADGRIAAGTGTLGTTIFSGTGFSDSAWHHVVFTRTTSGTGTSARSTVQLCVDGTLRQTSNSAAALTTATNMRFGSLQTALNFYAGQLDEVAV